MSKFSYEVTDGGLLLRYGAEDGVDLTCPSDNPVKQAENIARVQDLLLTLLVGAPEIFYGDAATLATPTDNPLAQIARIPDLLLNLVVVIPEIMSELTMLAAEIGVPCSKCEGEGGHEVRNPIGWEACPACGGSRVQAVAA